MALKTRHKQQQQEEQEQRQFILALIYQFYLCRDSLVISNKVKRRLSHTYKHSYVHMCVVR